MDKGTHYHHRHHLITVISGARQVATFSADFRRGFLGPLKTHAWASFFADANVLWRRRPCGQDALQYVADQLAANGNRQWRRSLQLADGQSAFPRICVHGSGAQLTIVRILDRQRQCQRVAATAAALPVPAATTTRTGWRYDCLRRVLCRMG